MISKSSEPAVPAVLKGARILVTGASGFLGGNLIAALDRSGCVIEGWSRPEFSLWRLQPFLKKIRVRKIRMSDASAVRRVVLAFRPRFIFHLESLTDRSRDPAWIRPMMEQNFLYTLNLLEAVRDSGAGSRRARSLRPRVVFMGSAEEYGSGPTPFVETQREIPVSPYSFSKTAASHLCRLYRRVYGVETAVLRPTVMYGPLQDNEMLIPYSIRRCLSGRPLRLTGGRQTRDFVYVRDVVDAMLRAAARPAAGEIINIGSAKTYSVREVVEKIVRLTGCRQKPAFGALPTRAGENPRYACSNNKAARLLGWRSATTLDEGLRETVCWFQHERS